MAKLNVSELILQEIQSIIKNLYPQAIVWAYGSRVNGTAHEGSDLDLVIVSFGKEMGDISKIKNTFTDSNIPFLIDIHYFSNLPQSFQDEIKKNYLVILEGK
jgi:predicted nucleotidyltransferase